MDAPEKYIAGLREIKRRTEVVDYFLSGESHALYPAATVESVGLQIRKILELIALGSLAANVKEYSKQHKNFARHWHAKRILKDLERLNPDFYPQPILQKQSIFPGTKANFTDRPPDYLTEGDLVHIYERCGQLMHAANPFGKKLDYDYFNREFSAWRLKYVNLLNAHTIHLVGDPNMYLFQMGSQGKEPTYTPFAPAGKPKNPT